MRKTLLSIAILAAGAAAVPFGFAGGDNCSSKTTGATLVSTDGGACTGGVCPSEKASAKVATASGCTSEKATLVSTGGDDCSAKTATAGACTEKTKLVSTSGDQCTDKTAAASGCCPSGDKAATLVSTDGGAADQAAKPMETLKSLAGQWKQVEKDGQAPAEYSAIDFKVSANGSVIVETMFPGQKHEMVNTYVMDGDRMLMTHYCAAGNQPRMQLVSNDGKTMKFKFVDATNLKSADAPHMGALELTILGPDRIREKWTSFEKGKEVHHAEFELERVK